MDYEKQLSVMALQFRACFTEDKWLWARILLFIIFGLATLPWLLILVAATGFCQQLVASVGGELDSFVRDEKRSPLVRSVMLLVAIPVSLIRYVVAPFFFMIIYSTNFWYNVFVSLVSLGKSGWHAPLQYGNCEKAALSEEKAVSED